MTNIFSPATSVDYKRSGGEPTVTVDRYPFTGPFTCTPATGMVGFDESACQQQSSCSATATPTSPCYKDLVYVSNPLGILYPGYSEFYKSTDLGQTFRVPPHDPVFANPDGTAGAGGGDSHQVVGEVTHSVFFVDLSGACVTMNVSRDLGETFLSDRLGCGPNPGAIDDRQWVGDDETYPDGTKRVYVSFNNFTTEVAPSITLARSKSDAAPGSFVSDSVCNPFTGSITLVGAPDATPTPCPDPGDSQLLVSGAIEVDKSPTSAYYHQIYIPFIRKIGADFSLWVAISDDGAETWTRHLVANVGPHNPANIFPNMTIDTAGNLYVNWSQDQSTTGTPGEQDVYYSVSQGGGIEGTWSTPTDITQENGDSAIFPWMVAGNPGQVDIVFYKANCGLNSNVASDCVWNVYFGKSNNLLTGSRNINSVQISDHPNNVGPICTSGLNCSNGRSLLDFFTIDVDHEGAANVSWADDNDGRRDTRDRYSHQIKGNGVFGQPIDWHQQWPIKNHEVTDPAGDVFDGNGALVACPSMDVLNTSEQRSGDIVTVTMTLGAPPSFLAASGCSRSGATGGLWGAEWWSASAPDPDSGGGPNDNFYLAFRDNPAAGGTGVEAGRMNNFTLTFTGEEFHPTEPGTLGGTCAGTAPPSPCTIVMSASLSGLGIKSGAGLQGITGLSAYYYGSEQRPPLFPVPIGFSQQADAAAPFDQEGTATLP